jgi:TPR repeat protein
MPVMVEAPEDPRPRPVRFMRDGNNRALILETARALFERNPDGFTVASVCRETGLSRSRLRRHFPTKGVLVAALQEDATSDVISQTETPGREFCEPALLPAKADDNIAPAQFHAAIEAPILAAELPPIVVEPPVTVEPQILAKPVRKSRPRNNFQARETALKILAEAQKTQEAKPCADWRLAIPPLPRLAVAAAILCTALVVSTGFLSFGGFARATQVPAPPPARHAEIAQEVLVIDATGAAPDPMFQEAPPALRAVIVRARRGETQAQVELAQSFLKGQGIGLDPVAAARWSDEAAAQGDPTAQFILGTLYAEGIKPNARLAFDWFSAAASRGNVKAMHNLAIAYLNGTGVTQDSKAAAAWFEKAAAAGYRDSAFDLAVLYERGEGVAQSGPDALKWYNQAASFGDPEAMQRATFLRSQLSQVAQR